jgi:hypothetical protein
MRVPDSVEDLERDLVEMFGPRLLSLVVYGPPIDAERPPTPTLAVIDGLGTRDLEACSARVAKWQEIGLATPLFLAPREFARALDAFPLEFGAILAEHALVHGTNPFDGLQVDRAYLRHACEVQARSHLLHLREGYVETAGRGDAIADLVARSAEPLAALLRSVARLQGVDEANVRVIAADIERTIGVAEPTLSAVVSLGHDRALTSDRARRIMPAYLDAVERLVAHVDQWGSP